MTGRKAAELAQQNKLAVSKIGAMLNVPGEGVVEAVEKLAASLHDLQKENKKLKAERFSGGATSEGEQEQFDGIKFVYHDFGETDADSMAGWTDSFKNAGEAAVALSIGILAKKNTFMASASKKAVDAGINIGKLFGALVKELGGRGGGKINFARGGLPQDVSFDNFVDATRKKIKEVLR